MPVRGEALRWRVLISAPYAMPLIDWYRSQLEDAGCEVVVASVRERLSEGELLPLVGDIDGIIKGGEHHNGQIRLVKLDAAQGG